MRSQSLLALLFCVGASLPAQDPSTRDSAGIQILFSGAARLSSAQALRIDSTPEFVIHQRQAAADVGQIRGIAVLANRSIVVADGASGELRLFDTKGHAARLLAQRGNGPRDFTDIETVIHLRGDTLALVAGPARVVYYNGNGDFLRNVQLTRSTVERRAGVRKVIVGAFGDGSSVVANVRNPSARSPGTPWIETAPVTLVDLAGKTVSELGDLPVGSYVMIDQPQPLRFSPPLAVATSDESFFVGFGAEYSIREYERGGRLARIIRRAWTPVDITREDVDRFVDEWGSRWIKTTGAEGERQRAALRAAPFARSVPAFSQLLADRAGRLWVRTPQVRDASRNAELNTIPFMPSRWSVFDARRTWLCDVTFPANFQPFEIGADYVIGVHRDAENVESVVLYRLHGGER